MTPRIGFAGGGVVVFVPRTGLPGRAGNARPLDPCFGTVVEGNPPIAGPAKVLAEVLSLVAPNRFVVGFLTGASGGSGGGRVDAGGTVFFPDRPIAPTVGKL